MKVILLFVSSVLLVGGLSKSLMRERFSLKLELVNPTGKLDSDSHFRCTLTNLTDTTMVVFSPKVEGMGMSVRREFLYKDGENFRGDSFNGFYLYIDGKEERIMKLHPKESVSCRIPLFIYFFDGILPRKEDVLKKIRQVRIRWEGFQYINDKTIKQTKGETLVSNWVEVDTEAVIALSRERLGK